MTLPHLASEEFSYKRSKKYVFRCSFVIRFVRSSLFLCPLISASTLSHFIPIPNRTESVYSIRYFALFVLFILVWSKGFHRISVPWHISTILILLRLSTLTTICRLTFVEIMMRSRLAQPASQPQQTTAFRTKQDQKLSVKKNWKISLVSFICAIEQSFPIHHRFQLQRQTHIHQRGVRWILDRLVERSLDRSITFSVSGVLNRVNSKLCALFSC